MSSLFEIHVTVHEHDDAYAFRMWCAERKYKPIHAVAANRKPQLMMSKYKNGTAAECVAHALKIAEDLRARGLRPIRTKVEAGMTSWSGVPAQPDYARTNEYFEWHLTYPPEHAVELERLVEHDDAAFVSYNHLKKDMIPMLTIRVPGVCGMTEAVRRKDALIERVKAHNMHTNDGIKAEYAVYDDNPELDSIIINTI